MESAISSPRPVERPAVLGPDQTLLEDRSLSAVILTAPSRARGAVAGLVTLEVFAAGMLTYRLDIFAGLLRRLARETSADVTERASDRPAFSGSVRDFGEFRALVHRVPQGELGHRQWVEIAFIRPEVAAKLVSALDTFDAESAADSDRWIVRTL